MTEVKYGLRGFVGNVREKGLVNALGDDLRKTFNLYKPSRFEEEQTARQTIAGTVIGGAVLGTLGALALSPVIISNKLDEARRQSQLPVLWEEYEGNSQGYNVEISDVQRRDGSERRIMHITAEDESVVPNRMTGHDYDMDGHFDRIFIMDEKYSPCDSVIVTNNGLAWKPSPASESAGKDPFTADQVAFAQGELYAALTAVKTDKNKVRHWTPGMGKEQNYGLINKSE